MNILLYYSLARTFVGSLCQQ